MINACICDSKITLLRLYKDKDGTLHWYVQVTDFPIVGQLEIQLFYSTKNTTEGIQTWWKAGKGNLVSELSKVIS